MSLPTRASRLPSPFVTTPQEFDAMLAQLFNAPVFNGPVFNAPAARPVSGGRVAQYLAPVDVREDAEHLYVEAEVPGFKKDEVEVTLENQVLTLSAEHKAVAAPQGEWLLNERRPAKFHRTFKLPETVDDAAVHATLADGVLTVTLDKRPESKPRKIVVD